MEALAALAVTVLLAAAAAGLVVHVRDVAVQRACHDHLWRTLQHHQRTDVVH